MQQTLERLLLPVYVKPALMSTLGSSSGYPDQDSDPDRNRNRDQRAVLDLARHPLQRVVADLGAEFGGFIAETHRLHAGHAPAAAKAIDDFGHGGGDGVTDLISGGRHASRRAATGTSPYFLNLVLEGVQAALKG
jgi:hypothetical protein